MPKSFVSYPSHAFMTHPIHRNFARFRESGLEVTPKEHREEYMEEIACEQAD
jgi:hypothetical protein